MKITTKPEGSHSTPAKIDIFIENLVKLSIFRRKKENWKMFLMSKLLKKKTDQNEIISFEMSSLIKFENMKLKWIANWSKCTAKN